MSDHKVYDTPLLKKIGLKLNQKILVLHAPQVVLQLLDSAQVPYSTSDNRNDKFDCVWLFINKITELESSLKRFRSGIMSSGMIWVS